MIKSYSTKEKSRKGAAIIVTLNSKGRIGLWFRNPNSSNYRLAGCSNFAREDEIEKFASSRGTEYTIIDRVFPGEELTIKV